MRTKGEKIMNVNVLINWENLLEVPKVTHHEDIDLRIDGSVYDGWLLTKEEFIEKFKELTSVMSTYFTLTDDEKYWVLYEERYIGNPIWTDDIFWCIPKEEITFVLENNRWVIWEESEAYKKNVEEYNRKLAKFGTFEANLGYYVLYNKRADYDVFRFWRHLQEIGRAHV